MFNYSSKIVPVVVESNEIPLDSHVVIRDDDDDMNGSCGTFKGVFKNEKLKLIEEYFEDNLKTTRQWQFEKIDKNKFIGNGKNIAYPFELNIKDNFLEMSYKFKTRFN